MYRKIVTGWCTDTPFTSISFRYNYYQTRHLYMCSILHYGTYIKIEKLHKNKTFDLKVKAHLHSCRGSMNSPILEIKLKSDLIQINVNLMIISIDWVSFTTRRCWTRWAQNRINCASETQWSIRRYVLKVMRSMYFY